MNLAIDIGNSNAKAALFERGRIVRVFEGIGDVGELPAAERVIYVSTRGDVAGLEGALRFDHTTPVPVKNLYATPYTLGYDRLAAAAGAHAMFPGHTVLTVDLGTAITYDIVTAAGEFLGGNISPGAGSRFRALHEFTKTLPLGALPENTPDFPARDTKTAIESGVETGIVAETEHYIDAARKKFGDIKIIFTGGDADYFAGRVKFPMFRFAQYRRRLGKLQTCLRFRSPCTIFAVPDLVFYGLNAILEHNANL